MNENEYESVGAEVIAFKRPLPHEEFKRKDVYDRMRGCQHRQKVLDDKLRIVTCDECGERMDPFETLNEHVQNWRIFHGPLVESMRAYKADRRRDQEDFRNWWARVNKGRHFATKRDAAEAAWRATTPMTLVPEQSEEVR